MLWASLTHYQGAPQVVQSDRPIRWWLVCRTARNSTGWNIYRMEYAQYVGAARYCTGVLYVEPPETLQGGIYIGWNINSTSELLVTVLVSCT